MPGIWIVYYIYNYHSAPRRGREIKKKKTHFFLCTFCVTIVPKRHIPHVKANKWHNLTPLHIPRNTTNYTWYCLGLLLGCKLHGRVWSTGHTILTMCSNVVQRSLTVVRPSQAFHYVIPYQVCECRMLSAIFPMVAYICTDAVSRRGIIDTTKRRHQWLVSMKDFRCNGILRSTQVWKMSGTDLPATGIC